MSAPQPSPLTPNRRRLRQWPLLTTPIRFSRPPHCQSVHGAVLRSNGWTSCASGAWRSSGDLHNPERGDTGMASLQHRPYRPLPIKLLNTLGGFLLRAGVTARPLSDEKLLAAARARTGLCDWGDDSFRQPLRLLVDSLEREAHLTFLGRLAARRGLTQMLVNRLEIREMQ